ncbi:hypothetical protein PSTT_11570 [Puccinia striiformis]|uniref:non-specific serine/threonine protein kinase n=1 Tax=Puccinia striiformis TaxID=27350 RepID=A0A2S4UZI4_9BASI|nr:hypothetical protein PSTT_11570 [Puccinia striiformis]
MYQLFSNLHDSLRASFPSFKLYVQKLTVCFSAPLRASPHLQHQRPAFAPRLRFLVSSKTDGQQRMAGRTTAVNGESGSLPLKLKQTISPSRTIIFRNFNQSSLNILPIQATSNSTAKNKHTQHEHTVTQDSYFELLSQSQCNTPRTSPPITPLKRSCNSSIDSIDFNVSDQQPLSQDKRIDGYYQRFFKEVMKLGRGQKGSVFLCTHTLDGNPLGDYAIKKIAVGQSSQELIQVLNEVKFLESLRHNNITQYHHAWIEESQLSRFGPKVPVLYILMNFANGGTLDDYISLRKGIKSTGTSSPNDHQTTQDDAIERNRMKDRFRKQQSNLHSRLSTWNYPSVSQDKKGTDDRAVHLFSFDEILNIFEDTCRGLGFLHSQGILHHDLKTENVLLHWASEDAMIPTAMISDFGSSISQSENWSRERTGRTGTLDWVPPESLKKDPKTGKLNEVTQKGDLWQLGLVLHSLCFFRLPYAHSEDIDLLKDEITRYPGFLIYESAGESERKMNRSDLPRSMIKLLSELLCLEARSRPSCERVLRSLEKIRDSIPHESPVHHPHQKGSTTVLQPRVRFPGSPSSNVVVSSSTLQTPIYQEEEEEGDTSKELTMVTRSTSSSSSTSTTTTSPRSGRTALLSPFITPDEHLNQLYDPRPRLLKPIHFPQSSLKSSHHSYFFRIFVHRFAPSAYPRIIKLLERPYFAPFFAMVICIKVLIVVLKIIVFIGSDYHPFKHHQSSFLLLLIRGVILLVSGLGFNFSSSTTCHILYLPSILAATKTHPKQLS